MVGHAELLWHVRVCGARVRIINTTHPLAPRTRALPTTALRPINHSFVCKICFHQARTKEGPSRAIRVFFEEPPVPHHVATGTSEGPWLGAAICVLHV